MKKSPFVLLLVILLFAGRYAPAQGFNDITGGGNAIENTATGKSALSANVNGTYNTATGNYALEKNIAGSHNTATGFFALNGNTTGVENTANGYTALNFNTTGHDNTASGSYTTSRPTPSATRTPPSAPTRHRQHHRHRKRRRRHESAFLQQVRLQNTADGFYALYLSTGSRNTAAGTRALNYLTSGEDNVALGYEAGYNVTTGTGNIEIGDQGDKADDETIRVGTQGSQKQAFVAGIFGTTAAGGAPVVVTSTGQLGTVTSSVKFKRNIRDLGDAGDTLMALRPVTFQYKSEIDPTGAPQFGLIAEEVEKVAPELVVRDANHQPYSVRYDAVNAMLLNEVQQQHKLIAQQQDTLAAQQKMLAALAARLDAREKVAAVMRRWRSRLPLKSPSAASHARVLRMRQRHRQRIRRIRRRILRQAQHRADHEADLRLLRAAAPRRRRLHAPRRILVNGQARRGQRQDRRPARRAQRDRRLVILQVNDPLHRRRVRLVFLHEIGHLLVNRHQATRRRQLRRILDHAIGQRPRRPPLDLDDAIARAAQGGIEAEDHGHTEKQKRKNLAVKGKNERPSAVAVDLRATGSGISATSQKVRQRRSRARKNVASRGSRHRPGAVPPMGTSAATLPLSPDGLITDRIG